MSPPMRQDDDNEGRAISLAVLTRIDCQQWRILCALSLVLGCRGGMALAIVTHARWSQ